MSINILPESLSTNEKKVRKIKKKSVLYGKQINRKEKHKIDVCVKIMNVIVIMS